MMRPAPFDAHWRLRPLLTLNILSLLLLASWLWPVTRALWDSFDDQLFTLLNSPLQHSHSYALVWALGSIRPMDIAVGLVMMWFLVRRDLVFSALHLRKALFGFLILLAVLLVTRMLFTSVSYKLGWEHASPSLIESHAVRLTELFPDWEKVALKDSAGHSFPGDHASVVLLWALFLSFFARGWKLALVWALTALFMLPRLVAGAHWGSDDFVGGLFISLMSIAWGCYTPFLARAEALVERLAAPLMNRLGKLPLLSRSQLFNPQP
ncbi:MAG: phosphatase PAP2 family protein [Pseudomonadota bacterium]|uniref:phosphatase PAP2 family protein n=1 Tax=Gallaecimonas pentaromativorans TaxID=584787 RepID=UPI001E5BB50D|nr:phosphatase PAP2 family protein [Gallaecimonas pentaromativorans]MED5524756.1 phosphatase PAP2 family protein [Pseudomonadota bacterium]